MENFLNKSKNDLDTANDNQRDVNENSQAKLNDSDSQDQELQKSNSS